MKGGKTMKKLNNYLQFNLPAFLEGKTLMIVSVRTRNTDTFSGLAFELMIMDAPNGDPNLYEKFYFKMRDAQQLIDKFAQKQIVRITSYEKASVFGDYNDKLSVIGTLELVQE